MSRPKEKSVNFFQALFEVRGSVFGTEASEFACEAAVVLRTAFQDTPVIRVLDLGCGDGRDAIFFAKQGFHVVAVDASSSALALLKRRAAAAGVDARIQTIQSTIEDVVTQLEGDFHLVFANYSMHFIEAKDRAETFCLLKKHTVPRGIHAICTFRDLNEEFLGKLKSYDYFRARELFGHYQDWDLVDTYEGTLPDIHEGAPAHEHVVSAVLAQNQNLDRSVTPSTQDRIPMIFAFCLAILSVLLCTLGYSFQEAGQIAVVWPGAVIQAVVAICFGGWGVLATILAGMVTNAINIESAYAVFAFIPANLIQGLIPAFYYRTLRRSGGWDRRSFQFWRFALFGVIVPNLFGACFGAGAIAIGSGAPFIPAFSKWLLANIPIALMLGWPLYKILGLCLVEEGWAVKRWWR